MCYLLVSSDGLGERPDTNRELNSVTSGLQAASCQAAGSGKSRQLAGKAATAPNSWCAGEGLAPCDQSIVQAPYNGPEMKEERFVKIGKGGQEMNGVAYKWGTVQGRPGAGACAPAPEPRA